MSKYTASPQLPLDGVRKFQNAARSVIDQGKETCGLQGMSPSGEERPSPSNSGSKVSSRQLLCGRGEVWNLSSFPSPYIEGEGVYQGWGALWEYMSS